jgi:hypothetical protein
MSVQSAGWRLVAVAAVFALSLRFAVSVHAFAPPRTTSVVRGCATANPSVPPGTLPRGWRSPSAGTIAAGPIAWLFLGRAGPHLGRLAPRHGLAPAVKAMVEVAAGAVVRVVIPVNERVRLSLDYTSVPPRDARQNLFRVADGASQVTFRACSPVSGEGPQTQFAGGFIVAGAHCALIDIYMRASNQPIRRQIPFGVPARSCPAAP